MNRSALPRLSSTCFAVVILLFSQAPAGATKPLEDLPRGKPFQLEETLNQLLGEEEAARYAKLMIIPGMGHERPDETAMAEALEFIYGSDDAEDPGSDEGDET